MWLTAQTRTSGILISLAHAQAERDDRTQTERHYVTDGMAPPLDRVWRTIRESLCIPLFEGPEEFVRREQEAIDHGGTAITEFWRHLGLTFSPRAIVSTSRWHHL